MKKTKIKLDDMERRKGFLGRIHIQANNLTNKLAQRLAAVFVFIVLLGAKFTPENYFQHLHITAGQKRQHKGKSQE